MKHAYLIVAHNNFNILLMFLRFMDHEDNDFFIHIDQKIVNFQKNSLKNVTIKSKIYFFQKMDVRWADISQVDCTIYLLSKAYKNNYDYYHLISGVDFPIKTLAEINAFFLANKGKEFITIDETYIMDRVRYQYILTRYYRNSYLIIRKMASFIRGLYLLFQKIFNLDFSHNVSMEIKKGSSWFSVTHGFVEYALKNYCNMRSFFKHCKFPDEHFFQTLIWNSPYSNNRYILASKNDCCEENMRYIDWQRGSPYTFTKDDFNTLIASPMLFARKFDENKDFDIVNKLFNYLSGEEK